jgi:hypothetical protein
VSIRLIKTEQDLSPGDVRELRGFWELALRAQGKSPNTVAVYTSALDRFAEHITPSDSYERVQFRRGRVQRRGY